MSAPVYADLLVNLPWPASVGRVPHAVLRMENACTELRCRARDQLSTSLHRRPAPPVPAHKVCTGFGQGSRWRHLIDGDGHPQCIVFGDTIDDALDAYNVAPRRQVHKALTSAQPLRGCRIPCSSKATTYTCKPAGMLQKRVRVVRAIISLLLQDGHPLRHRRRLRRAFP
jgi:hypothetical protein